MYYNKVGKKFDNWQRLETLRRIRIFNKYPEYLEYPIQLFPYHYHKARAFYNEVYPTGNPAIDSYWERYRNFLDIISDERLWTRWGICEECGWEGLVYEIGLNWVCDNPECEKAMNDWYKEMIKAL